MSVEYDPFERMELLMEQMRRSAFGPRVDRRRAITTGGPAPAVASQRSTQNAGITVEENDDGYVVLGDLPGFDREEIDLTFDDGTLTIDAHHEVTGDDAYRRRRVHEVVSLPADVDLDDAAATYRNGVLEVTLPVDEESTDGHRIDVE